MTNLQNEELLARYLLGDLPEEQQIDIENRAFTERAFRQTITAVENDLIDEYVRQEMSSLKRRQFEARFLTSAARRRRLEFARALATVVSKSGHAEKLAQNDVVPNRSSLRDLIFAFVHGLAPSARFSLVATALLIMVVGASLISQSLRQRGESARLQVAEQSQESGRRALEEQITTKRSDEVAAQSKQDEPPRDIRQPQPTIESSNRTSRKTVFSFLLVPGISRSTGKRPELFLPAAARLVRLQVGVEPEEQYEKLRVELRAQDGREVWVRNGVPVRTSRSGKTATLTVPTSVLTAGQYELVLQGLTSNRTFEEVGYYYFEVIKR